MAPITSYDFLLYIMSNLPCGVCGLQIGDRVGIIRLPEFLGSLVIYINGAPIGIIATRVSDNVYGFVEMQGDCEKICISSNRTIKEVCTCNLDCMLCVYNCKSRAVDTICSDIYLSIESNKNM